MAWAITDINSYDEAVDSSYGKGILVNDADDVLYNGTNDAGPDDMIVKGCYSRSGVLLQVKSDFRPF